MVGKFKVRPITGHELNWNPSFIYSHHSNTFQIEWLYLTYGIMFGGGSSLTYTPSLVILGHYFKKHMGMVNGFVASGSSVFTFVMPHILEAILSTFGVSN